MIDLIHSIYTIYIYIIYTYTYVCVCVCACLRVRCVSTNKVVLWKSVLL